jgi:CBS domain-containing protein
MHGDCIVEPTEGDRRFSMHNLVRDFMNPTLVYLPEETRPEIARQRIVQLGITSVPVLDESRRPVGIVSLRDLLGSSDTDLDPITRPAKTIGSGEPVQTAARLLVENDIHHLVVVDPEGRAIGMISTLDILRSTLGLTPKHPAAIDRVQ